MNTFTKIFKGVALIGFLITINSCQKNSTSETIKVNTNDSITSLPGSKITFDGYVYSTIILGNGQEWMVENLRTSKYRNGDSIINITENSQWNNLKTGAWAHYNNQSSFENQNGKLYNWYSIKDPRNICPLGWHIPSEIEWSDLINYLGGNSAAGIKMRSSDKQYYWNAFATNESGFTAIPSGHRKSNGVFDAIQGCGYWWSSTEASQTNAWLRSLDAGYISRNFEKVENIFKKFQQSQFLYLHFHN